jgi:glycyl-tRNA synthetase beta chain
LSEGQVADRPARLLRRPPEVQLREQGARHDLVDAVFALEGQDDLLLIVRRVEALGKFLDTDDGKNLLAGTSARPTSCASRRRRTTALYTGAPDAALYRRRKARSPRRSTAPKRGRQGGRRGGFRRRDERDGEAAPGVDAFFDKVTVNVDDKAVRENRLKLLNEIREATRSVADFSKIEG